MMHYHDTFQPQKMEKSSLIELFFFRSKNHNFKRNESEESF